MSDKAAEDYIELSLDTSGDAPMVMGPVEPRARAPGDRNRNAAIAEQPWAT